MIPISKSDLIACICEGSAEKVIIELLLDRNALVFSREQLLDGKVLPQKCIGAKYFTDQFLTMDYGDIKISVVVMQDRKIPYTIRKPYANKVSNTYLAITAPEIEMLMIHSLGLYDEYHKQRKKPSIFLAEKLKTKTPTLKSSKYVRDFFKRNDLVNAIMMHKEKSQPIRGGYFLADFLRS